MSLIGCVDTLSDVQIAGWAADDIQPAAPVSVEIWINGERPAKIRCDEFREDLRAAGIGNGHKGFRYTPSEYLRPGRNRMEVRHAGTQVTVPGGLGHWVRTRAGKLSDSQASFIAALEAYHEFTGSEHICLTGVGAADMGDALQKAHVPIENITRMDALAMLPETADIVAASFESTADVRQVRAALMGYGARWVRFESVPINAVGERQLVAFAGTRKECDPAADDAPVLAHVHVPKCAGTSLRVLLTRCFGPRHLMLYVNDPDFVYGDETLRSYLMQPLHPTSFSSHHVRIFPPWLAGREMRYITFLRDPIQQFVSYMTHMQKHYAHLPSSLYQVIPPDAPNLSLREFARWLLTQERDIPFRENHNVNFFARHSAPEAVNPLIAARTALEKFFFVGITERMEESMRQLRALAAAAGIDFPSGTLPVENISAECRDDLRWIHPADEVGAMLLKSTQEDRQLYEWAAARLSGI